MFVLRLLNLVTIYEYYRWEIFVEFEARILFNGFFWNILYKLTIIILLDSVDTIARIKCIFYLSNFLQKYGARLFKRLLKMEYVCIFFYVCTPSPSRHRCLLIDFVLLFCTACSTMNNSFFFLIYGSRIFKRSSILPKEIVSIIQHLSKYSLLEVHFKWKEVTLIQIYLPSINNVPEPYKIGTASIRNKSPVSAICLNIYYK